MLFVCQMLDAQNSDMGRDNQMKEVLEVSLNKCNVHTDVRDPQLMPGQNRDQAFSLAQTTSSLRQA